MHGATCSYVTFSENVYQIFEFDFSFGGDWQISADSLLTFGYWKTKTARGLNLLTFYRPESPRSMARFAVRWHFCVIVGKFFISSFSFGSDCWISDDSKCTFSSCQTKTARGLIYDRRDLQLKDIFWKCLPKFWNRLCRLSAIDEFLLTHF